MEDMLKSTCGQLQTSVLGFGCGSVLGRVGRRASLRAMNAAWDAGITLFDTARSYGFGDAEAVLGEFLRGKREQAIVATKFGIAPRKQNELMRLAIPAARAALRVPGVRKLMHRGSSREAIFGQFTAAGLLASLECSLRQLRTDRVDLLFLHEANASAMRQQDLIAELGALVQAGKVLRAGLYADAGVIAECMASGPATLTAMQFGANLFDPVAASIPARNRREALLIANHPFGGDQRLARTKSILAAISADETVPAELREKLRSGDWQVVLETIFGVILNGAGIHALVLSMMQEEHLRANARAVASSRFTGEDCALMRQRLLNSASIG
jgi:aryl-alcohol dehydrogenase-like predicted oxidoreductase